MAIKAIRNDRKQGIYYFIAKFGVYNLQRVSILNTQET